MHDNSGSITDAHTLADVECQEHAWVGTCACGETFRGGSRLAVQSSHLKHAQAVRTLPPHNHGREAACSTSCPRHHAFDDGDRADLRIVLWHREQARRCDEHADELVANGRFLDRAAERAARARVHRMSADAIERGDHYAV